MDVTKNPLGSLLIQKLSKPILEVVAAKSETL